MELDNTYKENSSSDNPEVSGIFLLGIFQSFYNLNIIPEFDLKSNIKDINPEEWYPYSTLIDLLYQIQSSFIPFESLLFRAGVNFLKIWYEQGPGKDLIHSGLDWLHANDVGDGYNSVVRGTNKNNIGWCLMRSLDKERGVAIYENVMPLPLHFIKGVFYGGCMLFDDMEYIDVDGSSETHSLNPIFNKVIITVKFRSKNENFFNLSKRIDNLEFESKLDLTPKEVENLIWSYKNLLKSKMLDLHYLNDINIILVNEILKDKQKTKKLIEANERNLRINRELSEIHIFNLTILQNSPIPMAVYSSNGKCISLNEAFATLAGLSLDNMINFNLNEIKSLKILKLFDACSKALCDKKTQRAEFNFINHRSQHFFLDCHISPIPINGEIHLLLQVIDATARKQQEIELREQAFHDSLTGIPNRRLLLDRMERAISVSKRQGSFSAVLFLDMNRFKLLNDTYGHDIGDKMLIEVSSRLKRAVRDTDTVARFGGDEFVILLENLGSNFDKAEEYVKSVSKKISVTLNKEYVLDEIRHLSSATIGIKLFSGDADPDILLKEADAAMYVNKIDRTMTSI